MKIKILSDLHLEFLWFEYEYHGEDVVILAGDITNSPEQLKDFVDMIPVCVPVIFIPGNHEFYGREYYSTLSKFELMSLQMPKRFYFLNCSHLELDGVYFYGGMMCTNFEFSTNDVEQSKIQAQFGLNDFKYIAKGDRRWSVNDHLNEFERFTQGLDAFLAQTEGKRKVVVSHFMPSPDCVEERFASSPLNPYFVADMTGEMGWDGLWFAGHGHNSLETTYGGTRLIMNPRGYCNVVRCENEHFRPDFVVEI